jgi:hypothetical protein
VKKAVDISKDVLTIGDLSAWYVRIGAILGVAALALGVVFGVFQNGMNFLKPFLFSYVVSYAFVLSLALGGLFFVLLQHLTRAGWSVTVRRLAEVVSTSFPLLVVLFIPIFVWLGQLYPWVNLEALPADKRALLQNKHDYFLNWQFFLVRWVIYFGVWIWLSTHFFRQSLEQDATGDPEITVRLQRLAAPAMVLFAITTTFAAFDLLMSLEPAFFSTIFGVYYFAGSVVAIASLLMIMAYVLQQNGRLLESISTEHYHDLGKLIFAFVVFWTYIAFSQYMLIWYANIPEETFWYQVRQKGQWVNFSLALLFGHFVIPFVCLISRGPKRRKQWLLFGAIWMLLMHWLDMYYLVMPQAPGAEDGNVPLSLPDLACLVGLGGLFVAYLAMRLRGISLVPTRDPRLPEALAFQNF